MFIYSGNEYLTASIQGNFSYAIFSAGNEERYLTSFIITDGFEIIASPMNKKFPEGLLVLQDGFNMDGDSMQKQNFKYVSFSKIKKFLDQQ